MTFPKFLMPLTLAVCSLVVLDQTSRLASSPGFEVLPDHQLAAVCGADREMLKIHVLTCEHVAKEDYGTITGGPNHVGASECDDTNTGATCVNCEDQASKDFGVDMGPADPGTGSQISAQSTRCGRLKRGTCGAIPGTTPTLYGCRNMTFVFNQHGEAYACSDLFGYMEDQSTGP